MPRAPKNKPRVRSVISFIVIIIIFIFCLESQTCTDQWSTSIIYYIIYYTRYTDCNAQYYYYCNYYNNAIYYVGRSCLVYRVLRREWRSSRWFLVYAALSWCTSKIRIPHALLSSSIDKRTFCVSHLCSVAFV